MFVISIKRAAKTTTKRRQKNETQDVHREKQNLKRQRRCTAATRRQPKKNNREKALKEGVLAGRGEASKEKREKDEVKEKERSAETTAWTKADTITKRRRGRKQINK